MPGQKSSNAEYTYRVQVIAELMVQGIRSRRRIIQYIRENDRKAKDSNDLRRSWQPWNVSDAQIDNYIADANKLFVAITGSELERERTIILEQLDDLYARSVKAGKFSSAVRTRREKAFLLGLGKINITVTEDRRPESYEESINRLNRIMKDLNVNEAKAVVSMLDPTQLYDIIGKVGSGHNGNGKNGNGANGNGTAGHN